MKKKLVILIALLSLSVAGGCSAQQDTSVADIKNDTVAEGDATKGEVSPLGGYAEAIEGEAFSYEATGADMGAEAMRADVAAGSAGMATPEEPDPTESSLTVTPETMLLTAGEWNDNENWGFFINLVNSDVISFPSYGIDPRNRTVVTVKSKDGKAIANANAELKDSDGNVLWSAVTNADGVAYLFSEEGCVGTSVDIKSGDKTQSFEVEKKANSDQSSNKASDTQVEVTFDGDGKLYKKMDIMFVMDATGSMSDEMLFLQSEFTEITKAVGTENTRYSVNFYRDDDDEYVTKCYDFTTDIDDLQKKINSESADGGGDIPEAVHEILQKTVYEAKWDDEAVKLMFIIFDAPPHDEVSEDIQRQIKSASEKGIRIIPVVSSNSERETELFGRAAAIATGGDYIFLTDDSGIGDSHLEPIIGDYEVKKLYDQIIEVINKYRQ